MNKMHSGLYALATISVYNSIAFDAEQISHKFNLRDKEIGNLELIKVAKHMNFHTKVLTRYKSSINKLPMPCIVQDKENNYFILAKADDKQVLILEQNSETPQMLSLDEFKNKWNNTVILLKHKDKKNRDFKFGISWFLKTIEKYKTQLIEVLIASFTLQIFGLFSPVIMQVVIDKVLVHNSFTTLDVMIIGLIGIVIFETLMSIARNYVFTNTTSKIDVVLGDRLFNHLIHLPLMYFENRRTGDTIARVKELENIRRFLTGTPLTTVLDLMFVVVYIIVMLFYSKDLTTIVLLSLPLFAIVSAISTPIFKKQLEEKFNAGAESQAYMVETVSGINTIKSLAIEPKIQTKWGNLLANYTNASYKTSIFSGNIGAIANFIQKIFDLIILWAGARLVIAGTITVGQLIAFRMLASRVSGPILRLVQLWQEFQQTKVSIERISDIFKVKPEIDLNQSKTRLPQIQGAITFENVSFRYRMNTAEVIKNMTFRIPAGHMIGIVGRSGSGKSTLAKLVQRLYIPESGKILIDGVDISLADTDWLRRQIGVVPQESFLFNASIKDNLCVNNPGTRIDKVIEICKIAGAHDFITEMPDAYDTILGENGTGLSGGQKQRIAIARALMDNPRILIFDEATSALDYESESIINANLKNISKGRTVLIIAHRLSTIKHADAVMAIDKGKVVEYGPAQKLLEQKGLYYHLYTQQFSKGEV